MNIYNRLEFALHTVFDDYEYSFTNECVKEYESKILDYISNSEERLIAMETLERIRREQRKQNGRKISSTSFFTHVDFLEMLTDSVLLAIETAD